MRGLVLRKIVLIHKPKYLFDRKCLANNTDRLESFSPFFFYCVLERGVKCLQ